MTTHTIPETPSVVQALDADRFAVACRQAAATLETPERNGRLTNAMDLVLAEAVTLHDDGTAVVHSGSHTYHLEPDCTCQDSQHRTRYCKHYVAVELLKRTYERLHIPVNGNGPQATPTAPQPRAETWQGAQAPSSCTLKWNIAGVELMLTLRDATDEMLFARIGKVLPKIEAKVEAQRQARQEQTPEQNQAEGYCTIHDVPMRRSKEGDGWYHKAGEKPDGKAIWCRGT